MTIASTTISSIPANRHGTDYFVGDIHGCFHLLQQRLDAIDFQPARDRLFSVGDLIDRGPFSAQVLEWLNKPFFYAVQGNHEAMFLEWHASRKGHAQNDHLFLQVGGRWVHQEDRDLLQACAIAFQALPRGMRIEQRDGRAIGLLHAELPTGSSWEDFAQGRVDTAHTLWGRHRISEAIRGRVVADRNTIQGIDALVVGHEELGQPVKLGNILYLDTGAWDTGLMTVLPAREVLDWPALPVRDDG